MSFPQTSVLDDFNRANEGPPPSSNWTTLFGAGSRVVSNQCVRGSAGSTGDNGSYWNVQDFGPDCEVFCTFATGGSSYLDCYVRLVNIGSGTTDGYDAAVSDNNNTFRYFRIDNDVYTLLGAAESVTVDSGDSSGLRVVGDSLQGYFKDVSGANVYQLIGGGRTDSTYTAAGKIGATFNNDTQAIDDFGGGTVPVATRVMVNATPLRW